MTDKWFDHWSVLNTLYAIRVWLYLFLSDLLKVVADPERDGRSPVAVPWNGPVSCISQPVPKTLLAYKLWNPAEIEIMLWFLISQYEMQINSHHICICLCSQFCMYIFTQLCISHFSIIHYASLNLNAVSFSCREIRGLLPPWQQKVVSANWWMSLSTFI